MNRRRAGALIACGAILVALSVLGTRFQTEDPLSPFVIVCALQSVAYATAVWLVWQAESSRAIVLAVAVLAIAMRVPPLLAPPDLSSDVYRYVWDGRVEAAGLNPYRYRPADPRLETLRDAAIYPQIASKYVPTIYPPVAEALFLAVTRVSESVTAMKAGMTIFDALTCVLLMRLLALERLPAPRVLVYAWHPLPVWEFAGSGHIDAALIAFAVAALYAARRAGAGIAGLCLAAATLTKFYPAVLAAALYRRWDWRLPAFFAAGIIASYLPFLSAGSQVLGFLPGYARQEGFDASGTGFYLLGLLRRVPGWEGTSARSFEIAAIAVLAALAIAFLFRRSREGAPYAMAAVLAAVFTFLLSPHYPWYFAWLIVFACFVRSFALLWLTNSCLLLYAVTDYVFVPSGQRLAIETVLYAPFATLALIDLWYYRRRTNPRS